MTSAYACSMSRRDHLARLLIGALSTTVAPPKRKASSPRGVATEFTALARKQGIRIDFPYSCPFVRLRGLAHVYIPPGSSCSPFHPLNHDFRPVFPTFLHFFHLLFATLMRLAWRRHRPSLLPRPFLRQVLFRDLASLHSSTQPLDFTHFTSECRAVKPRRSPGPSNELLREKHTQSTPQFAERTFRLGEHSRGGRGTPKKHTRTL